MGSLEADERERAEVAFLRDLTALSKKHGIVVSGCGCCGSPDLDHYEAEDLVAGEYGEGEHCWVEWHAPCPAGCEGTAARLGAWWCDSPDCLGLVENQVGGPPGEHGTEISN